MRRKVNNSETHETKRYYEVPSEKVQEWSDIIENLTKQRDQFKTERDILTDDLSRYKAKVSKLERDNEKLVWTLKNKEDVIDWNCLKIRGLKEDIEKYKRGTNNLINENDLKHNLLSEISQHIGNKPSSSTYKYFRGKLDCLGIKEGE